MQVDSKWPRKVPQSPTPHHYQKPESLQFQIMDKLILTMEKGKLLPQLNL